MSKKIMKWVSKLWLIPLSIFFIVTDTLLPKYLTEDGKEPKNVKALWFRKTLHGEYGEATVKGMGTVSLRMKHPAKVLKVGFKHNEEDENLFSCVPCHHKKEYLEFEEVIEHTLFGSKVFLIITWDTGAFHKEKVIYWDVKF